MAFDAIRAAVCGVLLISAGAGACANLASAQDTRPPSLASATVTARESAASASYDGVVQAVRQTVIAAQVAGAVVALEVKVGDTVRAGQTLLRLDARAAEQTAAAGAAQLRGARATQEAATLEFERQQQLFGQNFISQAALDRARAQFKTAQADAAAQSANAGAARVQSSFYVVKAPYSGVVADVAVVLGDMAMPGRPLLTLYDPRALRISVAVPQAVAAQLAGGSVVQVELPGAVAGRVAPVKIQSLPTADPATHTVELRLDLPPGAGGVSPGMFARAWLAAPGGTPARLYVPAKAVVTRAELTAVYVLASDGRRLLRQVRLGRSEGDLVEVLAGVAAGEQVALDPQAAARLP